MTAPIAPNDSTNTRTAANTDSVWPRPNRRSARTSGAINRLRMNARAIGTNTSRAKYKSANNVAVAMIPSARLAIAGADGSRAGESVDDMPYFDTETGSSDELTATNTQHWALSARETRCGPDHQKPPVGCG